GLRVTSQLSSSKLTLWPVATAPGSDVGCNPFLCKPVLRKSIRRHDSYVFGMLADRHQVTFRTAGKLKLPQLKFSRRNLQGAHDEMLRDCSHSWSAVEGDDKVVCFHLDSLVNVGACV